jgi:hypothetical protein
MAKLSPVKVNKALATVIENVTTLIYLDSTALIEVDKLNYGLCLSEEEKVNYTKTQIEQIKQELKNCNSLMAGYINDCITVFETNIDDDESIELIATNFINEVLYDFSLELDLYEDKLVFNDDVYFVNTDIFIEFYKQLGFDISILKDFIKYIALAKRFMYKKLSLQYNSNQPNEIVTSNIKIEDIKQNIKTEYSLRSPLKNNTEYEKKPLALHDIIDETKLAYIKEMLEQLSITQDGNYNMSPKKKSAIRGVAQALLDNNILPAYSINKLCIYFASLINLKLASKLQKTTTYKDYLKKANKYILENKL